MDATVVTYRTFIAKQGALLDYGGGWCYFGSCTQSASGNTLGPIVGTASSSPSGIFLQLFANVSLSTSDFPGATSLSYTFNWHAVATSQGGNPTSLSVRTMAGPSDSYYDTVPYTTDGTSVTYSGVLSGRPEFVAVGIDTGIANLDGSHVTIAYSPITFELHDPAAAAAASIPGASASSSAARSPVSSLSSTGMASNSAATSTTLLSSSTFFTTTISGHATVIQTLASQPLPASQSQSHLPSPSNSSGNTSMTVVERVGVVVGSLVGIGLILAAIAFWYQWRQRRRMLRFEGTPYVDRKSEISRSPTMANQELWAPDRKEPHGIPTTKDSNAMSTSNEGNGTSEVELVRPRRPRRHRRRRREGNGHAPGPPPPAYSQITPREASRASQSSGSSEEN